MKEQNNGTAGLLGKVTGYIIVVLILLLIVGVLLLGVNWVYSQLL